ncbi:MAG: iron-containing alcohol dehydrogenase [Proteobacteria bacterium]|nr:iron-containing alcohol dehydrogenase [Pseudomonadota bacterium]
MTERFHFYLPTRVYFGAKVIEIAGQESRRYGRRALMVSGGMAKKSGALPKVLKSFESAGIKTVVFDEVETYPGVETIENGARVARDEKCKMVVGIGGECPMDAAKAMAVLTESPSPLKLYFGKEKVKRPPVPIIAVPLTAGSGSEVTPFSAITTKNAFLRVESIISSLIYPHAAFVDPEFTKPFPSAVTINNGIDALSHAIEGYLSLQSQPFTDCLALEAVRLIREFLPKVLDEPENSSYRSQMSYAALLSGMVIAHTGIGLTHQMGYHLALNLGLAHGEANGVLLPWVSELLLNQGQGKLDRLANCLGVAIEELPESKKVRSVIKNIHEFISRTGLSPELERKGLTEEKIQDFSERTFKNKAALRGSSERITLEAIRKTYDQALRLSR